MTTEGEKKFAEDSTDWLRKNEPDVDDVDNPTVVKVANLAVFAHKIEEGNDEIL